MSAIDTGTAHETTATDPLLAIVLMALVMVTTRVAVTAARGRRSGRTVRALSWG